MKLGLGFFSFFDPLHTSILIRVARPLDRACGGPRSRLSMKVIDTRETARDGDEHLSESHTIPPLSKPKHNYEAI
jgi:hypothetical protein